MTSRGGQTPPGRAGRGAVGRHSFLSSYSAESLGLGLGDHPGRFDRHVADRSVAAVGFDFADLFDDGQAGRVGRLAEGRVLAIEVGVAVEADKELRAGRVWVGGAGHRQHARLVRRGVEFSLDFVAGVSRPRAEGAAALDHEAADDPMKKDAVVEADLRQPNHVLDVAGSGLTVEIEQDLAQRGIELDLVAVLVEVDFLNSGVDVGFTVAGHGGSYSVAEGFRASLSSCAAPSEIVWFVGRGSLSAP